MNAHTTYVIIAILAAIMTFSMSPAFAGYFDEEACPDCAGGSRSEGTKMMGPTETPISVWTDSAMYGHNSVIKIDGVVAHLRTGVPVTLTVTSPLNNLIAIEQITVNSDKTFSTNLSTSGGLWKYDGTYKIRVQYGSQTVSNKVLVELTGGITGPAPTVSCGSNELTASGQCIPYSISGGSATGAALNVGTTSLTVSISTTNDGMITLKIPRGVLDAKMNGQDDQFFVLVDGEESDYDESKTSSVRTLTIMFPDGAEEIEIIGTFAVPEFGTIAALILVVAIISIIAITAKTRLNVLPKY